MNATVTLPISELDNLRDTLKVSIARVTELENTQKEVKLLLVERTYSTTTRYNTSWGRYERVADNKDVAEVQYVNMDSVIEILRIEQEDKVRAKIQSLTYEIKSLKDKIVREEELWRDKIKQEKEAFNKINKAKDDEIAILRGEIVDLGKDHLISELESKISELNSKLTGGFLSKLKLLFNI